MTSPVSCHYVVIGLWQGLGKQTGVKFFLIMIFTSNFLVELAGWVPAIIFPSATSVQLIKIAREKTAEGVSILTWTLFGFANIGLYFYAEKYLSLQSILGQLGTAVVDFIIVGLALSLNRKKSKGLLKGL